MRSASPHSACLFGSESDELQGVPVRGDVDYALFTLHTAGRIGTHFRVSATEVMRHDSRIAALVPAMPGKVRVSTAMNLSDATQNIPGELAP